MTTKKMNNDKGFTIIEVVLVLAIAALIFLMIFIALPALQRGQANTARKNDIGIVASAVNTYRSNKSGALPADYAALAPYVGKLSQIESSTAAVGETPAVQNIKVIAGSGTINDLGNSLDKFVEVRTKAKCDSTNTAAVTATSSKQAAVLGILEVSSGNYDVFCQDV